MLFQYHLQCYNRCRQQT